MRTILTLALISFSVLGFSSHAEFNDPASQAVTSGATAQEPDPAQQMTFLRDEILALRNACASNPSDCPQARAQIQEDQAAIRKLQVDPRQQQAGLRKWCYAAAVACSVLSGEPEEPASLSGQMIEEEEEMPSPEKPLLGGSPPAR